MRGLLELPTENGLSRVNAAHAPNIMGYSLLQRVCMQLTNDYIQAIKAGNDKKAETLAAAAGGLERLAYANSFEMAYEAALEIALLAH